MEDIIYGRNPVLEALRSGRPVNKIMVLQGAAKLNDIHGLARAQNIPMQEVDRRTLDKLVEGNHQGIVAMVAMKGYVEVEEILERAKEKGEDPFILILDELEDPHNLGAILRTADAVGAHGIIIPKRRAVGLTSAAVKASAGAVEYVPVSRVTNLVQTLNYLKEQRCWIVGADASADGTLWSTNLKGPLGVVIGSEGKGISRLVKESCDFLVKLPMKGQIGSLNASVAAAVLCYEIVRQRSANAGE